MRRAVRLFSTTTDAVLAGEKYFFPRAALTKVARDALIKSGALPEHAELTADVLVCADERGIPSHGLNRLEMYCTELQYSSVSGTAKPEIEKDNGGTILVNGNNAMGCVVSKFAMDLCMERSKELGICSVNTRRSNHYGIAGYWTRLAREQNLIAWATTSTSPCVVPTRGSQKALGTNAFSCATPAGENDEFLLDMATSQVPIGKIEVMHRKGADIPFGWGVDKEGNPTDSSDSILNGGGLLPIAGVEETCGYKGYGVGLMVELLCGGLSNSLLGHNIPTWDPKRGTEIDYSQFFMCLDPVKLNPNFEAHTSKYLNELRNQPPAPSARGNVMIAGDPEKLFLQESDKIGVPLDVNIAGGMKWFLQKLEVDLPPEFDQVKVIEKEWASMK